MANVNANLTASAQVVSGPGILTGLVLSTTASGLVTCYDNTAGSGTVIFRAQVASGQQPVQFWFSDRFAPRFVIGLYVTLGIAGIYAHVQAADL